MEDEKVFSFYNGSSVTIKISNDKARSAKYILKQPEETIYHLNKFIKSTGS